MKYRLGSARNLRQLARRKAVETLFGQPPSEAELGRLGRTATTVSTMTVSLRDRNRLAAMDGVRRVAFELMSTKGFTAVTVEQIAAQSSVSPSTVYRYFGTKEALVLSAQRPTRLVERVARDDSTRSGLAAFTRAAAKVWGTDESAPVELALVRANPDLVAAWERQLLDQRTALAESLSTRRGASVGRHPRPGERRRGAGGADDDAAHVAGQRWRAQGTRQAAHQVVCRARCLSR